MDGPTLQKIQKLLVKKRHLLSGAEKAAGSLKSPQAAENIPYSEAIDMAQCLEEMERAASIHEVERRELQAIERALSKFLNGTFGQCEECGDEIPVKRLLIVPEARLCMHCQNFQERREMRQASRGPGSPIFE